MRAISSTKVALAVIAVIIAIYFSSATFSKRWMYAAWVKVAFRVFAIATIVSFGLKLP
jgi:hypothetical protein